MHRFNCWFYLTIMVVDFFCCFPININSERVITLIRVSDQNVKFEVENNYSS